MSFEELDNCWISAENSSHLGISTVPRIRHNGETSYVYRVDTLVVFNPRFISHGSHKIILDRGMNERGGSQQRRLLYEVFSLVSPSLFLLCLFSLHSIFKISPIIISFFFHACHPPTPLPLQIPVAFSRDVGGWVGELCHLSRGQDGASGSLLG